MKQIIERQNKKISRSTNQANQDSHCKCRDEPCPVEGRCQQDGVIYQTIVTHRNKQTNQEEKCSYIGMTGNTFKGRYTKHKSSFNLKHKQHETELSKHIWNLKDQDIDYQLQWKIIDRAKTFSPISKICQICTLERFYLIRRPDLWNLNSNTEFGFHCKHKRFKLLSHFKWKSNHLVPVLLSDLCFIVWPVFHCLTLSNPNLIAPACF